MKSQNEIRNQNLALVRRVFERDNEMVASRIARKAGLSVVTVNAILEEMCISGEIARQGQVSSGNGRPSALYAYNRHYSCGLVIFAYNSGDEIVVHTVVVNHFGEELQGNTESLMEIGEEHVLAAIDRAVTEFPQIRRLLFGLPGTERHGIVTSGDFAAFIDTAFLAKIKEQYDLGTAFINDINAAVYGHNRKAEKPCENEVGIFLPTRFPPGAGIIMKNELYLGETGYSGEVAALSGKYPWNELYRYNEEEIAQQLYPILLGMICVLNPGLVVFYGEYLTVGILERMQNRLVSLLPAAAIPEIRLLHTFETDFKNGLTAFMKETLWEDL